MYRSNNEFQVKESSCSTITSKLLDRICKDVCSAFYVCSLVLLISFIYQEKSKNTQIEDKEVLFWAGPSVFHLHLNCISL